jgi:hypothetical protein
MDVDRKRERVGRPVCLSQPCEIRADAIERGGEAMNLPKADTLASWENEGGSTAPPLQRPQGSATLPAVAIPGAIFQGPPEILRGADTGISDTHTLTVMRSSLFLLVPALGVLAVFWGFVAGSSPP